MTFRTFQVCRSSRNDARRRALLGRTPATTFHRGGGLAASARQWHGNKFRASKWAILIVSAALTFLATGQTARAAEETAASIREHSRFVAEIPLDKKSEAAWLEFLIRPDMFDGGRWDFTDLRLLDANDTVVPYAIRVRKTRFSRESIAASMFNRGVTPEGAAEVSLDLGESPVEHNEVEVHLAGSEFRRKAVLEGSDDGQAWNRLAEKQLIRFRRPEGKLEDERIKYSASRFRYLRVRVFQDPGIDTEPVDVHEMIVRRTVEVTGEPITREAKLGPRETGRQDGVAGSWWPVDLGGSRVPCQRLEVEVEDREFARNYVVTPLPEDGGSFNDWAPPYGGGYGYDPPLDNEAGPNLDAAFGIFHAARGDWRRRLGDPEVPLAAGLGDVRAGNLRLFIADSANQPLTVKSVKYVAPACLVVVANSPELRGPLRAYFGNAYAETPNYDFARNLPVTLDPPPARLDAGEREENPAYVPPPLPFTERFRWLIHIVLGVVSLLLAALVLQLARKVIVRHDRQPSPRESPAA